ncbi:DUF421 domain-containing protein [Halalkalibacter urbisdiaboli]|uniref:DUF421 domain-containing protein n=1 Tax=Halalkalibacter urbisdiaboli TaxID=1960589 RepID=UPI000B44DB51|nr:YetF domain-containing protein [Halalkalibacter urbisdiaboli]
MELSLILKSTVLVFTGVLLLRIAGRKSISQMTMAQTVIMISIGSIIIQPIIETSVIRTIVASIVFIAALIFMEWIQTKSNQVEKFLTGEAKIVIDNGQPNTPVLKKLRMTVDQLEMRLRQQGIDNISDVKTATLEPNGQLGYELFPENKPLTVKEFKKLMTNYMPQASQTYSEQQTENLFTEVKQKNHSKPIKSRLQ